MKWLVILWAVWLVLVGAPIAVTLSMQKARLPEPRTPPYAFELQRIWPDR